MDEKAFEQAEALTSAIVENNVDRIRSQVKPRDPAFDGNCDDCGDPIPVKRLDTGATTCIECQEVREQRSRQFAR